MGVVEFTSKVSLKILSLGFLYQQEIKDFGVSSIWKDIYLLSEASIVVNDALTDADCITDIITALDIKYSLESVTTPSTNGIGDMTIDPSSVCNAFTVYS